MEANDLCKRSWDTNTDRLVHVWGPTGRAAAAQILFVTLSLLPPRAQKSKRSLLHQINDMSCPVIDISPLVRGEDSKRMLQAAAELTAACHRYGFASLVGHGVPENLRKEAFKTLQDLFSLSHEQKMQAPHPPSAVPHRGYSSPGLEKVYGTSDLADVKVRESNGEALRKITDLKVRSLRGVRIIVERNIHLASISQESYEVGSEHNRIHGNIWLPEATLPGFRKFTTDLFWELSKLGRYILEGLATGLKLSEQERSYLFEINSGHNNQLRLLHYPSVPSELVDSAVVARMPAHTDWRSVPSCRD